MSKGNAMDLQIGMEQVLGRPVLFVAGSGDEALLTRVAKAIGCLMSTDDVRVVNVDDLLLSDVNATRAFLAHLVDEDAGEHLVLSCNRLTGRKLLRRWGGDDVAIFAETSQAVLSAYQGGPARLSGPGTQRRRRRAAEPIVLPKGVGVSAGSA